MTARVFLSHEMLTSHLRLCFDQNDPTSIGGCGRDQTRQEVFLEGGSLGSKEVITLAEVLGGILDF